MARVTLGTGDTITVGGNTEIFGTSGSQSVTILDNSSIVFRSGFNSGGDNIRINGRASDFNISIVGSNVILTSKPGALDNNSITIPIGTVANTLVFDGNDSRALALVNNVPTLTPVIGAAQTITSTPTVLADGPGVYSVAVLPQPGVTGTEGDTVTFVVTRSDTTIANEVVQFTVQGDTAGGTLPAAVSGQDFTAANNSVTFVGTNPTATFTVALNTDTLVEGVEAYRVAILKGLTTVATTSAVILDANNVGQTFQLTTALDRIGTGSQLDLIGSEGNTNTNGQDTIVATVGTINTFDVINGGLEQDLFIVLDNAAPFTFAPNFTNVTVTNVEALEYTGQRGLFAGAINTTAWAGLRTTEFDLISNADQTFTLATTTDADITLVGSGDVNVVGGGGALEIELGTGNVNVGTTGATNSWTSATVTGGTFVNIDDNGAQDLATIVLTGFGDTATLTGGAITSVSVNDLNGFVQDVIINEAANVAVTLSDINVVDLDVTLNQSGLLTVNGDSSVSGLDDITAGNNVTVNSTSGTLSADDVTANGSNRTITLNATGNLSVDVVSGSDLNFVNVNGVGGVFIGNVVQDNDDIGTVITSTNDGGVTIGTQLGNNTKFAGSGSDGADTMSFGATDRSNSFGGGDDTVTFNANGFVNIVNNGDTGAFDGGAGDNDLFRMESNNANTFSATAQAVSNFEILELLAQSVAKHDTINLANLGFNATTGSDVISNVGDGAVQEVTTLNFSGVSSSAPVTGTPDTIVFSGPLAGVTSIALANGANGATIAGLVAAQINADLGATYTAVAVGSTVTITNDVAGDSTPDITGSSVTFVDGTSVGAVSFEQVLGNPTTIDEGNAPVAATTEVRTLTLDLATVLATGTITITADLNFPAADPTFVFTAPADLSSVGGELADFFVAQWTAAGGFTDNWIATRSGNNVVFTAVTLGDQNPAGIPNGDFSVSTTLASGTISINNATVAGADAIFGDEENVTFTFDGTATGEDQIIFDGVTITLQDGDTAAAIANAFETQYNAVPAINRNWVVTATPGGTVFIETIADINFAPNLTAAAFQFIDDTNVGTPSVSVAVTTQGSNDSVTLNNFISGSSLTLNALNGTHTVNTVTDTSADVLNLVLANGGDHGLVTVPNAETVNIDTQGIFTSTIDVLDLFGGDLTTLVIEGVNGLTLDTNSTRISSIDATGLGGKFTWAADANTVTITVRTGGDSDVDFSAMTIQGGNASTGNAPIVFIGGSGDDEVTTGNIGSSRGTITTGAGDDIVFVGIVDGGNDYWSITDFNPSFDKLDFAAAPTLLGEDQALEPTAIFQDYLDQAARGNTGDGNFVAGGIRYFFFDEDGDGDFDATYVVQDNTDAEDFVDGSDTVIRLEGVVDLTPANFI